MSYTKGPWFFADDGTLGTVQDAAGRTIAQAQQISHRDRHTNHAERQANARLIAAAPDLLEACQITVKAVEDGFENAAMDFSEAMEKLKAAIAKAEGCEP